MEVDWRARTAGAAGKTTPEELIAAAHSACFSMALSNILAGGGNPPDSLSTNAVAVFESGESGFHISSIELSVSGSVPGISAEDFADAARKAKDDCPVSKALSDDVTVSVQARLI
jgi:osmotically inducible protein OsmC